MAVPQICPHLYAATHSKNLVLYLPPCWVRSLRSAVCMSALCTHPAVPRTPDVLMLQAYARACQKRESHIQQGRDKTASVSARHAVQTEFVAACELLDEECPLLSTDSPHGDNAYTLGRIGGHHIVIACLPKGRYGILELVPHPSSYRPSVIISRASCLSIGVNGVSPQSKIRAHDLYGLIPASGWNPREGICRAEASPIVRGPSRAPTVM